MKNLLMTLIGASLLLGSVAAFAHDDVLEVAQSDKLKAKLKAKAEAAAKKAKVQAEAKKAEAAEEAKAEAVAAVPAGVNPVKAEDEKHAANVAKIARLKEIATTANNADLLKKVVQLSELENSRHSKKVALLSKAVPAQPEAK